VELATYTYATPGPHTVSLRWGDLITSTTFDLGQPQTAGATPPPQVMLFQAEPLPDDSSQVTVRLQVAGLTSGQRLRLDSGAGQIHWLATGQEIDQLAEWHLYYVKPGEYSIALDLLDGNGFWLDTLAGMAIEVPDPVEEIRQPAEPESPEIYPAPEEIPSARESDPPWLPFRYARPLWSWSQTFTRPAGNRVSRSLAPGTYLAVAAETIAGGDLWYQSSFGDWIAASAVALVQPSELRGVELQAPTPIPPPPPSPPPGEVRHGIVTAGLLNVRAEPGVRPDNPPIAQLPHGTAVTIYEEAVVAGATWYRIGEGRWVHGGWVELVEAPPPEPERHGVVTATRLNVRARPGVSPSNPPIDQLVRGTQVSIYEEQPVDGATWYRIGPGHWVHGGWVRIVEVQGQAMTGPLAYVPNETASLPVGWVVSSSLHVRARPNTNPDNPPIDQVEHNQRLDILEEARVDGKRWYRIGEDRWVTGQWVAVARQKPRPSGIGSSERWVAVNLKEQTAVAYEGDLPVYAAMVATGLPGTPTVQGIFRTWQRVPWRKMSGGSAATGGYYYLEEVTWTCYFYSGYALHTAYWHDAFGRPRSHGCVNLSPYDAWWIFQWSAPGGAHSPAVYVYWT
jgi:hypothetical protein